MESYRLHKVCQKMLLGTKQGASSDAAGLSYTEVQYWFLLWPSLQQQQAVLKAFEVLTMASQTESCGNPGQECTFLLGFYFWFWFVL